MTPIPILCFAVVLLAGACTTTGGGKDRGHHRTGPPKGPHHIAHKHDRLRHRMVFAAGVMAACGRRKDARRAAWNARVANKSPKRPGRWSGRRLGKALRRSTDAAARRRDAGRLRCRGPEVARIAYRIDKVHARLSLRDPRVRPPKRVADRPPRRDNSEPPRRRDRERDRSRRRSERES
ncbi:MAG: hypothetical protein F4114_16630 [Rhodospirillaceae bacterium]|nr:hypothetical protein [Rhodospirillaceae bacterium]MYB13583.1 hypothetical protein [Rhodospirillaceae bacterium]MYI50695.1 hypothetical protein [Rhodospirillaceae bacterium]